MNDGIGVTTVVNPDGTQHVVPQIARGVDEKLPDTQEKNEFEEPAKTEILTKTDIEIRKLHALRRTKEYYEQKLTDAAEKALSGESIGAYENESAAVIAYNVHASNQITNSFTDADENKNEKNAFFKTDTAISRYKTYKKDVPKAWETGDMDEKR